VLELLGRGGMGAVYKAQDADGQLVALKVVARDLAVDPSLIRRFGREGRAAAAVQHPNVVRVIETGEERGIAFIASELLPGDTLEDLLSRRGKIPWREAVSIALGLAGALEAVHAAGLVHRDVKPGNALLDEKGEPASRTSGSCGARRDCRERAST